MGTKKQETFHRFRDEFALQAKGARGWHLARRGRACCAVFSHHHLTSKFISAFLMEDLPYGTSICFFSSHLYQGLRRTLNFETQNNVCGLEIKDKTLSFRTTI